MCAFTRLVAAASCYSSYLHVPASFKLAAIAARIRRDHCLTQYYDSTHG